METNVLGSENICNPAVKYKYSNKHKCWTRTWFTIEEDKETKIQRFKQRVAFAKDRNTDWAKWNTKPVGAK